MRRIGGDRVGVVVRGQAAKDQRHGHHVLDAVVAVGVIGQRAGLVNDAHAGFLRLDLDALDLVDPAGNLRVQAHGALHRGLGGIGRVGDLNSTFSIT